MGSSILSILAVDEGKIGLAITRRMEKGKLDVLSSVMERFIEAILFDLFIQEIQKPIFRTDLFAIENESEARIEIGIVPEALEDQSLSERQTF